MNPLRRRPRISAAGSMVALVLLLMLPNLLWFARASGIEAWIEALLVPAALLGLFFALLGDVPWLACLLLMPFSALAPLETLYIAQYHHPTSAEIIATLVATNPRETREYLGQALIPLTLCIAGGAALALLTAWWNRRSRWRNDARIWVLLIALLTPMAAAVAAAAADGDMSLRLQASERLFDDLPGQIEPGYPFGVFQRFVDFDRQWNAMRVKAAARAGFRFHAHRATPLPQRQVYVLVI
ncbi:MAG: hypothetical protein C4338_07115, partial [Rhodanobacteraceae bacterium]